MTLSLRHRFALLAVLLGLLLGGLAAAALLAAAEDNEYVLANEILRGQAEDYGLRLDGASLNRGQGPRRPHAASLAHRKPMLPEEDSAVLDERAATR